MIPNQRRNKLEIKSVKLFISLKKNSQLLGMDQIRQSKDRGRVYQILNSMTVLVRGRGHICHTVKIILNAYSLYVRA